MRNEKEILSELAAERAAYHAGSQTETRVQQAARSETIKALMSELSAALADGAEVCQQCGNKPHGAHVKKGHFEIGCLHCTDNPHADGVNPHAIGETREEAVVNWNAWELSAKQKNV